jgi:hypothetical protein
MRCDGHDHGTEREEMTIESMRISSFSFSGSVVWFQLTNLVTKKKSTLLFSLFPLFLIDKDFCFSGTENFRSDRGLRAAQSVEKCVQLKLGLGRGRGGQSGLWVRRGSGFYCFSGVQDGQITIRGEGRVGTDYRYRRYFGL